MIRSQTKRNDNVAPVVLPPEFPPIVDMHCHLLPGVDDGSPDEETSIGMLEREAKEGVGAVIATPHFYADDDDPEDFLLRREDAARRLKAAMVGYHADHPDAKLPAVYLGAEVAYFPGICYSETVRRFVIGGGNFVLVELPFGPVSPSVVREIVDIRYRLGIWPIVAHLERHLPFVGKADLAYLLENGAMVQSNAAYMLQPRNERRALRQFAEGTFHVLGTDAHDVENRPPELAAAVMKLYEKYGMEAVEALSDTMLHVLAKAKPME